MRAILLASSALLLGLAAPAAAKTPEQVAAAALAAAPVWDGHNDVPEQLRDRRKNLLQSISEAAATAPGWSAREPSFYPEWVEKIDETKPAN